MSKGINKFLDMMKLTESEDDYDDYDEDEEMEDESSKPFFGKGREKEEPSMRTEPTPPSSFADKKKAKTASSKGKLVPLNGGPRSNEVYVIKPQEFNEAQIVADFLKDGKTIVINMEGIEIYAAQRIIDFISGACYALNGTLQAISSNIFIAAPEAIEVSGDLRDEILNDNMLSPEIGKYRV